MSKKIKLINSNAVVIARFNLSIINDIWLYRNKIFSNEELNQKPSLPIVILAESSNFSFQLIPDRLQLTITPGVKDAKNILIKKIGKLIKTLPHTPYIASGLNFNYHVILSNNDVGKYTRSLFCHDSSKLISDFETNDARFGGYFSKDIIDTRLKLDIKPINVIRNNIPEERIQLAFNFHRNIDDNDINIILKLLEKWDDALKISNEIANKFKD